MPKDLLYLISLFITLCITSSIQRAKAPSVEDWRSHDSQLLHFRHQILHASKTESQVSSKPDNIIFLGTSRTMNGVNTPMIKELLNRSYTPLNLAINWFGHGIQLTQLEHWVHHNKNPKMVILEVPMLFRWPLHPHFMAHHSITAQNALWESNPYKALKMTLAQGPRLLIQNQLPIKALQDNHRFNHLGYLPINTTNEQKQQALSFAKQKISQGIQNFTESPKMSYFKSQYYHLKYRHQTQFLLTIKDLCLKHGIELKLLILPKCGVHGAHPLLMELYREIAPIWIPPETLLQKPIYWRDLGHLNQKGASILAKWLFFNIENS
jgi:hypothetical protein